MLPAGWIRDVTLSALLVLVGLALGAATGAPGFGMAIGLLVWSWLSWRRVLRVHRWLGEGALQAEPPVHDGLLGDLADRIRHQQLRLAREIAELEGTLRRLRDSYSALRDGIVILGPGNAIEWFNSSAQQLLDLRQPEDIGRQLLDLVRNPAFTGYLRGGVFDEDCEFTLSAPRALTLQVQAAAFGDSGRVLFVRDVSALRHLEVVRRDFVANISHELRTPLTVISGYVDTLAALLPTDFPAAARALGQMREQAARMQNLLQDLLLLARLEGADGSGPAEDVDIGALLRSVRESALASCSSERRIDIACPEGLRLHLERLQLESIVSNLVFNAVQYTAPGGRIGVELRAGDAGWWLQVTDDGIGIDPVHIPRLTERFYRVDKSRSVAGGGTGLGLAIVKHALNRLGGRLEIESRPGAGSRFACWLPATLARDT